MNIGIPFSQESCEHFRLAVRSVFAQDGSDWKLLLVADGARPELVSLAARIEDDRVRLLNDGRRQNLATRLNQLVAEAGPGPMVRMDADDVMHPRRVSALRKRLDAGGVDVVGSRAWVIDETGNVLGLYRESQIPVEPRDFLRSNVFCHPTVAGSHQWFQDNKYDEEFERSQDKELWARTASYSNFEKLDEPLLFYRVDRRSVLRKSLRSSKWNAEVLRRHGPALVGRRGTMGRLAALRIKDAVLRAGLVFPLDVRLLARRLEWRPEREIASAHATLKVVAATEVPGWPSEC